MRSRASSSADCAIVGAVVHTLDPAQPSATAVAWRDGIIVAVGSDSEIRRCVDARTRVVRGDGMTVIPGLVDSHIHPFFGTQMTRGADLRSALTLDDVCTRLAEERGRSGRDGWVLAHSARYEPFHASGIHADAIAEAVGDAPALIRFYDGHTALASHTALACAEITGPRTFTESAEIVCENGGHPTGALLENAAIQLVAAIVPSWREDEALDAYATTLRALNRVGLTGGHAMLGDPDLLSVCRRLEERGDLSVRLLMPMHQEPGISDAQVERHLTALGAHGRLWRTGTAKFFLDGVLDSGTAWLVDPGPGGVNAEPFWPDVGRYAELVARFTRAGFSAVTHAVGDGAVRSALDAYEAAGPPRRGMHRIEHIETLLDEDLERFAALGVAASMQPLHLEGLDDPTAPSSWKDGLSAGRYERGFRSGDLAASGATLPLGSDWMVADFDPRVGMAWAQLRRAPGRPDRVPYLPAQALTPWQALHGYTTHAAAAAGDSDLYGRVRPGLRADLTALHGDPLVVSPDELPEVPVLMTVVDGDVVFARD